ncbi:peroxiredoxin [Actinomadura oligospora]|uniref:peroxiredoxin n=1 Tax=Actinomadura oligospora TaxID=111804 RepID=UPI001B803000
MPHGGPPARRRLSGFAGRIPGRDRRAHAADRWPHRPPGGTGRAPAPGRQPWQPSPTGRRRRGPGDRLHEPARRPARPRGRRCGRPSARREGAAPGTPGHRRWLRPPRCARRRPHGDLHLPTHRTSRRRRARRLGLDPGARGCTPEACGFRDHHQDLLAAGADDVYGLSSQETDYQREVVERLHLPFQMLSDPGRSLARQLALPAFEAGGQTLYTRLTLIIRGGVIEHAFYPIFPPNEHAGQVLAWLRNNPL